MNLSDDIMLLKHQHHKQMLLQSITVESVIMQTAELGPFCQAEG